MVQNRTVRENAEHLVVLGSSPTGKTHLDDGQTTDLVLGHDVQNVDQTRRGLTIEQSLLRFALQLEFYAEWESECLPLYVLMLMSKMSFTLSG